MRRIGTLPDEARARRFGDYLLVHCIENQVESDEDGTWAVWVYSEDEVEDAKVRFERFRSDPTAAEFDGAERKAQSIRAERDREEARSRSRTIDVRTTWGTRGISVAGPVTGACIVLSIAATLVTTLDPNLLAYLRISNYVQPLFLEVRRGEVWRLLTPIFVHYGPLHILFNLFWLLRFGGMIEYHRGSRMLAVMILITGVASVAAEYVAHPEIGAGVGGMSGVIYGLFGYIWMRSKYDSASGLALHPSTVTIMLVWYVVCWLGLLPIANIAHTAGLVIGVAWGFLASGRLRPPR